MQKEWHTATKPLKKEFSASGYTAPKKNKTSGFEFQDNQLRRPEASYDPFILWSLFG
jgi:hypothetical protein